MTCNRIVFIIMFISMLREESLPATSRVSVVTDMTALLNLDM